MKTRFTFGFLAATAIGICTSPDVWGALVTIANPDFEVDLAADPDTLNANKTSWGAAFDGFGVRSSGSLDPGIAGGAVFAGENNYLQLQVSPNPDGLLGGTSFVGGSQLTTATILPNTRYTLTAVVARDSRNPFPVIIDDDDEYGPALFNDGYPTTVFRLFKASDSLGLGQATGVTLVSTSPVPAPGSQTIWKRVYETNATPGNLGIGLHIQMLLQTNVAGDVNGNGGGLREILFDNIRLDVTHIPEPTSAALLGVGAMALMLTRRREDSQASIS